ncbi:MAG: putative dsRNA-binding protein, partial [Gammaproteobacteria bacterium]
GWRRDSILANALEALLGAIFLDGGIEACRDCVRAIYAARLGTHDPHESTKDPKTALQEYLQARHQSLPRYETTGVDGPPHEQVFTVRCEVDALPQPVSASGRSRRKAEQSAARTALRLLQD